MVSPVAAGSAVTTSAHTITTNSTTGSRSIAREKRRWLAIVKSPKYQVQLSCGALATKMCEPIQRVNGLEATS
jgi:hypothetical protein